MRIPKTLCLNEIFYKTYHSEVEIRAANRHNKRIKEWTCSTVDSHELKRLSFVYHSIIRTVRTPRCQPDSNSIQITLWIVRDRKLLDEVSISKKTQPNDQLVTRLLVPDSTDWSSLVLRLLIYFPHSISKCYQKNTCWMLLCSSRTSISSNFREFFTFFCSFFRREFFIDRNWIFLRL